MFQVYVCVCALGHDIKCVYHGHNKRKCEKPCPTSVHIPRVEFSRSQWEEGRH